MSLIMKMFDYMVWANRAVWKIVEKLTDEDYNQILCEGSHSLQDRYLHLAEDTWEWFHDWRGEELENHDLPGMAREELFEFMMTYIMRWRELLDNKAIPSYIAERDGKEAIIHLDEMAFHLVNHHTYHRGQIVMGLRLLGKDVQMTDYIPYKLRTT